MNNYNENRIEKIDQKISKDIIAIFLVDEYKSVKICLNENDHKFTHSIVWYVNPEQKFDFSISNENNDGVLLQESNFSQSKLKDIKEFLKGKFYTWTVMWDDDRYVFSYELYMNDK